MHGLEVETQQALTTGLRGDHPSVQLQSRGPRVGPRRLREEPLGGRLTVVCSFVQPFVRVASEGEDTRCRLHDQTIISTRTDSPCRRSLAATC